jgi:aspartyl-tRNA synthetase
MFPESACLKTNFGTNLEFLSPAVAEKSLGKVGLFCLFFAFPAIHALTKLVITFDGLNRFFRMIACFKGNDMSVYPALLEF